MLFVWHLSAFVEIDVTEIGERLFEGHRLDLMQKEDRSW